MTGIAVFISRVFARILENSPLSKWATTKSPSTLANWVKSLAAIFDIDRLVSLDFAWWPFKAMELIEARFSGSEVSVFEWGSGASTIWMARRGYQVVSVEHDQKWEVAVRFKAQELNLSYKSVIKTPITSSSPQVTSLKSGFEGLDFHDYVAEIHKYELFDLIVIDGRARVNCLIAARSHLKPGGIILFDNSNRKRYRHEIAKDWSEIVIRGLTPASPFITQSSILAQP